MAVPYPRIHLALDILVLALCIAGAEQTREKAGLPFPAEPFFAASAAERILAVDGMPTPDILALEQATDARAVGDTVQVTLARGADRRLLPAVLIRYYTPWYLAIQAFTAAAFFLLGALVLRRRSALDAARVFHCLTLGAAALVMLTRGHFAMAPAGLGHALRAMFPAAGSLTGSLLCHFSLLFPARRPRARATAFALHGAALLIGAAGAFASLRATLTADPAWVARFNDAIDGSRVFLVLSMAAAVVLFARSYREAREDADRKRLGWVLYGFTISAAAFAGLWQLPQLLLHRELIPEAGMLLLLVIAPAAIAIAMVRHHLFDIDILIRRSTIYSIVIAVFLGVFVLLQLLALRWLGPLATGGLLLFTALVAVVEMVLFEPARGLVQRVVDRVFFRVRYNFREAQRELRETVQRSADEAALLAALCGGIRAVIPVPCIAAGILDDSGGRHDEAAGIPGEAGWRWWWSDGMPAVPPPAAALRDGIEHAVRGPGALLGSAAELEGGIAAEAIDAWPDAAVHAALAVPLRTEQRQLLGFLLLGAKRSGFRFSGDDVALLVAACDHAALEIARRALQRSLLEQRIEAERLAQLNRLKSFFVSTVSHDLKTPLTSIKLFAELLRGDCPSDDAASSLSIIEGECDRLAQLIENVLDFTRMEQGIKGYLPAPVAVQDVAEAAAAAMRYTLRINGFELLAEYGDDGAMVHADAVALRQALVNILANAIRYSPGRRDIALATARDGGEARIAVTDHGTGIAAEDIPHLFESFYRGAAVRQDRGGTGLGLAIVRHVVDAHGGRVEVRSTPGSGSTFTIILPILSQQMP